MPLLMVKRKPTERNAKITLGWQMAIDADTEAVNMQVQALIEIF